MDMTPNIHYRGEENNLLIANEHEAKQNMLDLATAKDVADALNRAYPGHLWAVNCQGEQGVLTIHNLMLSGQWGFTLLLDKSYSASELHKRAIMAGGEVLERYKVSRGRINNDQLADLPMDFAGRVGDTA
jgi:hypothetical protein